jgi:hypothetical protein
MNPIMATIESQAQHRGTPNWMAAAIPYRRLRLERTWPDFRLFHHTAEFSGYRVNGGKAQFCAILATDFPVFSND